MTLVLAQFPERKLQTHMFAPVLACKQNDVLVRIDDPKSFAPSRGTIFVPQFLTPASLSFPDIAVWEVFEDSNYQGDNGDGRAKLKAKSLRQDELPIEILSISILSTQHEELSRILREDGLRLPFTVEDHQVLIKTFDGVLFGPLTMTRLPAQERFVCAINQLANPIQMWQSKSSFSIVECSLEGRTERFVRTFVGTKELPTSNEYLDLAPFEVSMQTLLRQVCKDGPGSFIISKKDQANLVTRLSSVSLPEMLEARRKRFQASLDKVIASGEDIDRWISMLLATPSIQERIDAAVNEASESAKDAISSEAKKSDGEIGKLEDRIVSLKSELGQLQKKHEAEKEQFQKTIDNTCNEIVSRATEAASDIEVILSQAVLLRPFLNFSSERQSLLRRTTVNAEAKKIEKVEEALSALKNAFERLGIQKADSQFLSKGVLASVITSQFTRFSGSFGSKVARCAAAVLGGKLVSEITVLPSADRPNEFERMIADLSADDGTSVVLQGCNNACFDLYGKHLSDQLLDANLPFALFGSISDSAASLLLTSSDVSLGPVFNTDGLSWTQSNDGSLLPSFISKESIVSQATSVSDDANIEDFNRVMREWKIRKPALWFRNLRKGISALQGYFPTDFQVNSAIVSYGWIVPLAEILEINAKEVRKTINSLSPEALANSPQLEKSLNYSSIRE